MYKEELSAFGYSTTHRLYTDSELQGIFLEISDWQRLENYESKVELFAIRNLLKNIPSLSALIFNDSLISLVTELGDEDTYLVKAIYFDKPEGLNWCVPYHQDISVSVNQKHLVDGYSKWTIKKTQIGVVPPVDVLKNIFTVRIHLDDTNAGNGPLRVIPKSHFNGIRRVSEIEKDKGNEVICTVKKGHAMLMKPLIFHASSKSKMINRRRVIHLEFSNKDLKAPLVWGEKKEMPSSSSDVF